MKPIERGSSSRICGPGPGPDVLVVPVQTQKEAPSSASQLPNGWIRVHLWSRWTWVCDSTPASGNLGIPWALVDPGSTTLDSQTTKRSTDSCKWKEMSYLVSNRIILSTCWSQIDCGIPERNKKKKRRQRWSECCCLKTAVKKKKLSSPLNVITQRDVVVNSVHLGDHSVRIGIQLEIQTRWVKIFSVFSNKSYIFNFAYLIQ